MTVSLSSSHQNRRSSSLFGISVLEKYANGSVSSIPPETHFLQPVFEQIAIADSPFHTIRLCRRHTGRHRQVRRSSKADAQRKPLTKAEISARIKKQREAKKAARKAKQLFGSARRDVVAIG
jgi:hypothetical protein